MKAYVCTMVGGDTELKEGPKVDLSTIINHALFYKMGQITCVAAEAEAEAVVATAAAAVTRARGRRTRRPAPLKSS